MNTENQDVHDGCRFSATLHLTTPYYVLIHHDEIFHGPPNHAPIYGSPAQGMWLPNTKSFKSLGIDLPEFRSALLHKYEPAASEWRLG